MAAQDIRHKELLISKGYSDCEGKCLVSIIFKKLMFQNGNEERTLRVSFFKEFSLLLRLIFNYKYRSDSSEREAGAGWGCYQFRSLLFLRYLQDAQHQISVQRKFVIGRRNESQVFWCTSLIQDLGGRGRWIFASQRLS